jgi:hypothetical protein
MQKQFKIMVLLAMFFAASAFAYQGQGSGQGQGYQSPQQFKQHKRAILKNLEMMHRCVEHAHNGRELRHCKMQMRRNMKKSGCNVGMMPPKKRQNTPMQ